MFKKLKVPLLLLTAALTVLAPTAAMARPRREHRHVRVHFYVEHGPRYHHFYGAGYYDQWGYWHPHGY